MKSKWQQWSPGHHHPSTTGHCFVGCDFSDIRKFILTYILHRHTQMLLTLLHVLMFMFRLLLSLRYPSPFTTSIRSSVLCARLLSIHIFSRAHFHLNVQSINVCGLRRSSRPPLSNRTITHSSSPFIFFFSFLFVTERFSHSTLSVSFR